MSLEIVNNIVFKEKHICGSCWHNVHAHTIQAGAPVLVRRGTDTDKAKKWADSRFFGKVIVPFDITYPSIDSNGIVHFIVPTAVEGVTTTNRVSSVDIHKSLAHDFAVLP